MKRDFTMTSRDRLFLFLCFITMTSISVAAEEYQSIIRYDRIWEHVSVNWTKRTVFYEKFDGPEEINGKTYHRLVSFRKASYDFDAEGKAYVFDVDENYYKHEGYLREEDGKVYTLICNEGLFGDDWHNILYIPNGNDAHPADLEEKLLYDFTCKEGDSYNGLHLTGYEAHEMVYNVKSVESIEIDGEQCRRLLVSPEGYDDFELPMVEGVGIDSEYGCLTSINFLYLPTCPCMDHIFNRLLSADGRTVYGDESSNIPIIGDLSVVYDITQPSKDYTSIYDIMGRRISTPAPGQLYIQGGKKKIAPKN
ncbi:MAG: hypothetical protein K2N35_04010 [Muribaculaceae bacterium]|nr:hypothetical protein [Muribaculaceae bacterium]